MKVYVDDDSCAGHGVCAAMCPEVFMITDDGYAVASGTEVPPALEASVVGAVEGCPERAIHLQ